jgi:hypothetical protein
MKRDTQRGVGEMRSHKLWSIVVFIISILVLGLYTGLAQVPSNDIFIMDYQDPAGDVMIYNSTENGTLITDTLTEGLDIKWVFSRVNNDGNLELNLDLKAKEKFINDAQTKYVFRLFTAPDNSTGYNITYQNQITILTPFSDQGNGTEKDISSDVSFTRDKGDEIMVISILVTTYFQNVTHFGLDAYSMKVTDNATYLDYISELPGHPEYVNPQVEEQENLDGGDPDDKSNEDSNSQTLWIILAIVGIVIVLLVLIFLWLLKKSKQT